MTQPNAIAPHQSQNALNGSAPAVNPSADDITNQCAAAASGLALADRSHIGRLKLTGEDALDLLNRLSTNKLDDLAPGGVMGSVLTTNKGRVIDLLFIARQDDHLLVLTSPDTRRRVAEWIDFYTFVEDVEIADITQETAMFTLLGASPADAHPALAALPPRGSAIADIDGVPALAVRYDSDLFGADRIDLIAPHSDAPRLRDALLARGATPVSAPALDLLRIERGIPAHPNELNEDYNPLEAGLWEFISFNKGCYIGQEVVARLNAYDKIQRHLVKLTWQAPDDPAPQAALYAGDRRVGALTSVAPAEAGKRIGLGYVRKAHAAPGTLLCARNHAGDDADIEVRVGAVFVRQESELQASSV